MKDNVSQYQMKQILAILQQTQMIMITNYAFQATLTIHGLQLFTSNTIYSYSKPGLAISGFGIHVQNNLKRNPADSEGNLYY